MRENLHWKKGAFSTTYKLFAGEEQIGYLQDRTFKQTSHGEIRRKKYQFKTQGIFKQHTQIFDADKQEAIGSIRYNSWMNKAEIMIHNRRYRWKYDNGWQSKWSITDSSGKKLRFAGGMTGGSVEGRDPDDLLVLTGLFVTNYYTQAGVAVFVAIFVPIWVSVIN